MPPPSRLLRKLDPVFTANLKQKIAQDPHGPGVSPAAVMCKNVTRKEQLEERIKDIYLYEVLGGLHRVSAKQQLSEEFPDSSEYSSVLAFVYIGLTDEEALWLACKHNVSGHFNHYMTHRDYVSA